MSVVWSGKWIEAVAEGRWEYVRRARGISASVILAITDEGEVVLTEEYRVALGGPVIGLPAGLVGDETAADTPEAAARRELSEEAGYSARNWRSVGEFATSPGMSSETYHFFIATGLERVGAGGGIAGEAITVHHVKLGEVAGFVAAARARGVHVDGKLLCLLAFARAG
ncbi:MAG: NUDIX hydrolase [Sphingomonadaceae bacterium]|nr:NUDIX hydrolase [Sphingomonadaceae bacterium]